MRLNDLNLLIYVFKSYKLPIDSSLIEALFTFINFTCLANLSVDQV